MGELEARGVEEVEVVDHHRVHRGPGPGEELGVGPDEARAARRVVALGGGDPDAVGDHPGELRGHPGVDLEVGDLVEEAAEETREAEVGDAGVAGAAAGAEHGAPAAGDLLGEAALPRAARAHQEHRPAGVPGGLEAGPLGVAAGEDRGPEDGEGDATGGRLPVAGAEELLDQGLGLGVGGHPELPGEDVAAGFPGGQRPLAIAVDPGEADGGAVGGLVEGVGGEERGREPSSLPGAPAGLELAEAPPHRLVVTGLEAGAHLRDPLLKGRGPPDLEGIEEGAAPGVEGGGGVPGVEGGLETSEVAVRVEGHRIAVPEATRDPGEAPEGVEGLADVPGAARAPEELGELGPGHRPPPCRQDAGDRQGLLGGQLQGPTTAAQGRGPEELEVERCVFGVFEHQRQRNPGLAAGADGTRFPLGSVARSRFPRSFPFPFLRGAPTRVHPYSKSR